MVSDKLAYAQKWPTILYQLRPGSIAIDQVRGTLSTYKVRFEYDFLVSNGTKEIDGIGQSELVLDVSSEPPQIKSENGETLTRKTTEKSAASQFALYVDKDSPGGDYREVDNVLIQACAVKCVHEQECNAFTYNTSERICFLKNGADSELIDSQGAITGIKQVPRSTKSGERDSAPAVDANSGASTTPAVPGSKQSTTTDALSSLRSSGGIGSAHKGPN